MLKKRIIQSIDQLIYNNIYCSNSKSIKWSNIAANGYEKRIIGFKAEIEFPDYIIKSGKRKELCGGYLIPQKAKHRSLKNPIYVTITNKDINDYIELYKTINRLKCQKQFLVKYHELDDKQLEFTDPMKLGIQILKPNYTVYKFIDNTFVESSDDKISNCFSNKDKVYKSDFEKKDDNFIFEVLEKYSIQELTKILADRYIFDGIIGLNKIKGISSDIDLIIENDVSNFTFFEIKEKDKSKSHPFGFGIDIPRMNDIVEISEKCNIPYYYIVKHVNNQKDRLFLEWLYIDIKDFQKCAKKSGVNKIGGQGMNTAKENTNQTVVIAYENFKKVNFP